MSQEVTNTKFGNGMLNVVAKDSSWSVKFAPRIQLLSVFRKAYDGSNYKKTESNFLVRRARLKFSGFAFSPKLKYKLELGLTNRDIAGVSVYNNLTPRIILDAVVKWNFYKNFVLWAGQTKLPGNRERVISSANLQLVDRSLLNKWFNIDRDIGLQLRHHDNIGNQFVIREIFSFAQGEGRNITVGNLGGYQYTGRLEVLPFGNFAGNGDYKGSDIKRESSPKLAIGATYDYNSDAVKTRSNMGKYMITDSSGFYNTNISTIFLDAMFKYHGASLEAEYASRVADDPIAVNSDGSETGDVVQVGEALNVQGGYIFQRNWELSARYTTVHLDKTITGIDVQNQYTLGVSKYISGHKLKVQSDISYLTVGNENNSLMYRLQLDVHF
ncbi:MAG: porin [Chlorobi bacterium]|nr:porin [Chlorobiota bacterium]